MDPLRMGVSYSKLLQEKWEMSREEAGIKISLLQNNETESKKKERAAVFLSSSSVFNPIIWCGNTVFFSHFSWLKSPTCHVASSMTDHIPSVLITKLAFKPV